MWSRVSSKKKHIKARKKASKIHQMYKKKEKNSIYTTEHGKKNNSYNNLQISRKFRVDSILTNKQGKRLPITSFAIHFFLDEFLLLFFFRIFLWVFLFSVCFSVFRSSLNLYYSFVHHIAKHKSYDTRHFNANKVIERHNYMHIKPK